MYRVAILALAVFAFSCSESALSTPEALTNAEACEMRATAMCELRGQCHNWPSNVVDHCTAHAAQDCIVLLPYYSEPLAYACALGCDNWTCEQFPDFPVDCLET